MSLGVALKNKGKGFTIVKIDDIEASEENVKNGKYKIKRPLIMLFNKVNKDELISDFVNSVLARKKEVLEKNEFIAE
jgi:phosphate transport system substrate-binding protein